MKNWLVKVKNMEGWHKINDIIAPSMDAADQGNYYDLEGVGKVHQNNLEDMRPPEDVKKLSKSLKKEELLRGLSKTDSTYNIESDDYVFYYSDIDNAGKQVEKAFHDGDLDKIMDVSSRISNSRAILKAHVDRADGLIIVDGGDDQSGRIKIINIDVLEDAKQEIFNKTGYTVTIGVGHSPKQSVEALAYGKLTGKNKIALWSKSVEEYISKVKGITPEEKVAEVFNAQDK